MVHGGDSDRQGAAAGLKVCCQYWLGLLATASLAPNMLHALNVSCGSWEGMAARTGGMEGMVAQKRRWAVGMPCHSTHGTTCAHMSAR